MNTSPATTAFHGWRILAVLMFAFVVAMAFPFFGAGVLNEAMGRELGLTRNTISLGFSLLILCAGLFGPLVAWSVARLGARLTMIGGLLLVAAGGILLATAVHLHWQFVLVFGGLLGTGMAFAAAIPAQAVVAQWFSRRLAMAMSILWLAVGGGGALAAPMLGYVLKESGNWRMGWWLMAALAVLAVVLVALFVRERPADVGQVPDGPAASAAADDGKASRTYKSPADWSLSQALRTSSFWITTLCAVVYSMPLTLMFAHLSFHVQDLGHTVALAASGLGLMGAGQVAGKLLVGVLGDRVEPRRLWALSMVVMAAGMSALVFARAPMMVPLAVALMGLGQGGSLVAMPTLISNYYGPRAFAAVSGVIAPMITLCISVGPVAVGFSRDRLGSYTLAFLLLAAVLLAASILMALNRPPAPLSTTGAAS